MNEPFVGYNGDVKNAVFIVAVLLAATSCTSLSDAKIAEAAAGVSDDLNTGDVDALTGSSGTPFLFETEILPAPAQLRALWEALAASGYDFGPKGEITVLNPDKNTWERFSSSREVEVWFQKHAPRGCRSRRCSHRRRTNRSCCR